MCVIGAHVGGGAANACEQSGTEEAAGLVTFHPIFLSQALSVNPELGSRPASPRDLLASVFHSSRATDSTAALSGFLHGCQGFELTLAQQVLFFSPEQIFIFQEDSNKDCRH